MMIDVEWLLVVSFWRPRGSGPRVLLRNSSGGNKKCTLCDECFMLFLLCEQFFCYDLI